MSNLVTVPPKFFFNFLSQLEISSIYLFTAGFQLPAALKEQSMAMGLLKLKEKTCHSQTKLPAISLLNTNTLFEVIHLVFSKGTLCNLASGDL